MNRASTDTRRRLPALLAAVGLLFSAWLELVHFRAYVSPSAKSFCSVGTSFDCGTVALSRWSVVLGVPLPLWGVAAFLAMTLLAWFGSRWLLPLAGFAAASSVVLLGVELVSVRSVCLLCEGVHLASLSLFAVAWRERSTLTNTDPMLLVHIFTVPVGIVVIAHTMLPAYWAAFTWKSGVRLPHGEDGEHQPWIGAESPKIVVHEYTDYFCPHCAVNTSALRRLLAAHPNAIRVVHHNFPRMRCSRSSGPMTCNAARAVNCAGDQGRFWEMDSWLFAHAPGNLKVDFAEGAREVGIDPAALDACMNGDAAYERADREALAASRARVIDAPSYFIDGRKFIGGEVLAELQRRL